jgi:hypothetical protein
MTEDKVRAIFLLANIPVQNLVKIENEYWQPNPEFNGIRHSSPWWLVAVQYGFIKIGWRKRVINIDWSATPLRIDRNSIPAYEFHKRPITTDEVTEWDSGIHAEGYHKAIEYLTEMDIRQRQWEYATSEEGVKDLSERKRKYDEKCKA